MEKFQGMYKFGGEIFGVREMKFFFIRKRYGESRDVERWGGGRQGYRRDEEYFCKGFYF